MGSTCFLSYSDLRFLSSGTSNPWRVNKARLDGSWYRRGRYVDGKRLLGFTDRDYMQW